MEYQCNRKQEEGAVLGIGKSKVEQNANKLPPGWRNSLLTPFIHSFVPSTHSPFLPKSRLLISKNMLNIAGGTVQFYGANVNRK